MNSIDCFCVDKRSRFRRFGDRLFPSRDLRAPEDLEGYAPSYLVTRTVAHLDFLDRVRLLFSGKLQVTVHTKTDVIVNKMASESTIFVMRPDIFG